MRARAGRSARAAGRTVAALVPRGHRAGLRGVGPCVAVGPSDVSPSPRLGLPPPPRRARGQRPALMRVQAIGPRWRRGTRCASRGVTQRAEVGGPDSSGTAPGGCEIAATWRRDRPRHNQSREESSAMSTRSTVQRSAAPVTQFGARQASTAAACAAWDARLDRARIAGQVSDRAREEVLRYWRESPLPPPGSDLRAPLGAMPHLREEVEGWRYRLERRERMVLVEPVAGLNFHQRRSFGWLVATLLGEPLVQNDNGDRVVSVWARPGGKRVIAVAPYHQTR